MQSMEVTHNVPKETFHFPNKFPFEIGKPWKATLEFMTTAHNFFFSSVSRNNFVVATSALIKFVLNYPCDSKNNKEMNEAGRRER